MLTEKGVLPGKDKTEAIRESSPPGSIRQEVYRNLQLLPSQRQKLCTEGCPAQQADLKGFGMEKRGTSVGSAESLRGAEAMPPEPTHLAYPDPARKSPGSRRLYSLGGHSSLIQFDDDDNPRALG